MMGVNGGIHRIANGYFIMILDCKGSKREHYCPWHKKRKTLFICDKLGGGGDRKVADEFQREKNVSRTDLF